MSDGTVSINYESAIICGVWFVAVLTIYFDLKEKLLKFREVDIFSKVEKVSKFDELRENNWKAFRYIMLLSRVHLESQRWEKIQKNFMAFLIGILLLIVIFMLTVRNAPDVAWLKWAATISVGFMALIVKWRMWLLNSRINRA
jgi:hypothetical protein